MTDPVCGWCSTSFKRKDPRGPVPLFCSRICTAKTNYSRRRARKDGKPVHKLMPRDIFDRDGWMCHICAEPIDRDKRGKHPRAPALDHLIPIAHPDYPGHIAANVAASHWGCNAAKNARLDEADRALYERLAAGLGPGIPLKRRPWSTAEQTHCMNGHEFTPENTYIRPDRPTGSGRQCKRCMNDRRRRRNATLDPAVNAARVAALREKHGRASGHQLMTRTRVIRAWAVMTGREVSHGGPIPKRLRHEFDQITTAA